MSYKYRFLLLGIGFGFLFPVIATLLDSWLVYQSITLQNMMLVQTTQPLLLIIDTAPIFLGLLAFIAGRHYDNLQVLNNERALLLQAVEKKNEELEVKVALRTELLNINMNKAMAASQAKSKFVASISHELRTPLTAINGALELIRGGVTGPVTNETANLLALAHKNCHRLTGLIQDLLDLNALENGSFSVKCHVQPLIPALKQAISENKLYAEACGVQLELISPSRPYEISIDKDRFVQILTNIISNAIKFSLEKNRVIISVSDSENKICVSVQDFGCGITEEKKANIFESFNTTNLGNTRETGGVGLGLKIAKELTENMQGSIDFESRVGEGSTFRVWFPIVQQQKQVINRF